MFEKGEYVVYGTKGICEVREVTTLQLDGTRKDRLYYMLCPLGQKDSKIFVPVDSNKTTMRRVISREEADNLIRRIPDIQEITLENEKLREETYKQCLRSCDCSELVRVIKTLYVRMNQRVAEGKKVTATDERYFRMAEDSLYSELSLVLDIPQGDMEQYIASRMEG